ncbi:MAG: serine/threonine protein kinase [Archangium sp.]|nr:serine/threonine protein kinase [Archangium sp.]
MTQCVCGALAAQGAAKCDVCGRDLTRSAPHRSVVLAGKWRIERTLGHGGMGVVYLATDVALGRRVALKRLHPHFAKDEQAVKRLLREARVLARLDHPNLVPIHAVEVEDGVPMLAMKFVEGQTLGALLAERGKLSVKELVPLTKQLCDGCSFLHRQGFVHRDLKPSNVLVQPDGRVVLLDFGLARPVKGGAQLTDPGAIVGSAPYMSPEQVESQPVDQRSDLFSLCTLLWEALAGQRAYPGSAPLSMVARLKGPPKLVSEVEPTVPVALAQVINRGLARNPAERFDDFEAFAKEFAAAARVESENTQDDTTSTGPLAR